MQLYKDMDFKVSPGILVLGTGDFFWGTSVGWLGKSCGDLVFNTSMSGYQELLTDPSYKGQTVVLTFPEIGNVGVDPKVQESASVHASGLLIKNYSSYVPSKEHLALSDFLQRHKVPALSGIPTRALVKIIRNSPGVRALISCDPQADPQALLQELKSMPDPTVNTAELVSCTASYDWCNNGDVRIAVLDFGTKRNILRILETFPNSHVRVFPHNTGEAEIRKFDPCGVVLSNGPGDPMECKAAIALVQALRGKIPILGICLGHQIIGLSYGLETYRMKTGHRASNHPVKDLFTNKVYITSQNHGFAVKANKDSPLQVMQINLNDNTVSGFICRRDEVVCVQYHPEGCPGPQDSRSSFFQIFIEWIQKKYAKKS